MANLTIVANIQARADKVDLVKAELQKLVAIHGLRMDARNMIYTRTMRTQLTSRSMKIGSAVNAGKLI